MHVSYNVVDKAPHHPKVITVKIRDDEVFYDHVYQAVEIAICNVSPKLKIIFGGRVAQFKIIHTFTTVEQANRICSQWHRSKPIRK